MEKYYNENKFYSGVNSFWLIQNNKPVINTLNHLSNRKTAKAISTYGFSTLYTEIPHNKLMKTLNCIVDKLLNILLELAALLLEIKFFYK